MLAVERKTMTLILSCLTNEYAIQVSDRRLTNPDGTLFDDNSNKAIFVNGNIIFGYTGLAFLDKGKTRTDEWLLNAFNNAYKTCPRASLTTTLEFIAKSATETVKRINTTPMLKRLALVGVGWGKLHGQDLKPIYVIVSNSHNPEGRWLSQALPKFSVLAFTPPSNLPVMLVSDGQPLKSELRKRVSRLLKRCVKKGLSPKSMTRVLVATVRNVASSNARVGRNLLVSSIPKNSVHIGSTKLIGQSPTSNHLTFMYVPEDKYSQVQYGPHVFHHGILITEIKVTSGLNS
jgi:hypothetical protein